MSRADRVGRLRRRLVIEAPSEVPDGAGGYVRRFAPVATVWGAVEPVGGSFALQGDRAGLNASHRITIRKRDGLGAQHRFRDGTRLYQTRSVHTSEPGFVSVLAEEIEK